MNKSNIHDRNEFYFGITDYLFKNILFGKDTELTKWFLGKLLHIKVDTVEIKNTVYPKRRVGGKSQNMDVLVVVNGTMLLDIEANSSYYKNLHKRNLGYAMSLYNLYIVDKKEEENIEKLYLIDLTRGIRKKYKHIMNKAILQTHEFEPYVQNFVNLVFDIDKALKFWYYEDEKRIKEYFYLIMLAIGEKDLNKLFHAKYLPSEDKKFLKKYKEELTDMNRNREYQMWKERYRIYMADIRAQKIDAKEEGREEGILENKKENAKRMLQNNLEPELISRCTGLSLKQVFALKKSFINI